MRKNSLNYKLGQQIKTVNQLRKVSYDAKNENADILVVHMIKMWSTNVIFPSPLQ